MYTHGNYQFQFQLSSDVHVHTTSLTMCGAVTCVVDELRGFLHTGVGVVVIAKMEGPYPSTEHCRVLLWTYIHYVYISLGPRPSS